MITTRPDPPPALGAARFQDLDEGGTFHLVEPWSTAGQTLFHAAMALGAPELVPENDRVHLLHGWHALRGRRS